MYIYIYVYMYIYIYIYIHTLLFCTCYNAPYYTTQLYDTLHVLHYTILYNTIPYYTIPGELVVVQEGVVVRLATIC